MTWIDLTLLLVLAATTALGAERRVGGALLGLGGVLLFRPLLLLAGLSPLLAVVAALGVGLGLALAGRRLAPYARVYRPLGSLVGGVGGFALGTALVLAVVTSLPIERNLSGLLVYPPTDLPAPFAGAVRGSRLVGVGRDILLYPLLDAQGEPYSPLERPLLQALHGFLVVGEPWERR